MEGRWDTKISARVPRDRAFSQKGSDLQGGFVFHSLAVAHRGAAVSFKSRGMYGTHFLDHLAADGAGLAGGQVAVVAVGQIDAHLPWCPSY